MSEFVRRFVGSSQIINLRDGRQVQGVSHPLPFEDRNWEMVVFQRGRPHLDSEFNLMQMAFTHQLEQTTKAVMRSGLTAPLAAQNNATPTQATFVANTALVDGRLVRLHDGGASAVFNVTLPAPPASGAPDRDDLVYVAVYRQEVAAPTGVTPVAREDVKRYGNLAGASVPNDLRDLTLSTTLETSRRVQRSYRVMAVQGATSLLGKPAYNADGSTLTAYTYAADVDAGTLVAGDGTEAAAVALGTTDGYVRAMELARVLRPNGSTSVNAAYVTALAGTVGLKNLLLASIQSATAGTNGLIRLAGDLTGTAEVPVVATGAINAGKLAPSAVETGKIADLAVTMGKIGNGQVSTAKLEDLAVTAVKIANGEVNDTKIGDRTIDDTTALGATPNVGSLATLFGRVAAQLKAATGKPAWSTAPVTSLELVNTRLTTVETGINTGSRFQLTGIAGVPGGATVTVPNIGLVTIAITLTVPANQKLYLRRLRAGPAAGTVWVVQFSGASSPTYSEGADSDSDSTVYTNATASPVTALLELRIRSTAAETLSVPPGTGCWVDLEVAP